MKAPCRCASLKVLGGGAEDAERVAAVQGPRGWEGCAAPLVRTTVQDFVVGVTCNAERYFESSKAVGEMISKVFFYKI